METPDAQELELPPSSAALWRLAQTLMDVSEEIEEQQSKAARPRPANGDIRKRLIHLDERWGDKEWYYLAVDPENNDVFVLHEWSRQTDEDRREHGSEELDLGTILKGVDVLQERLRYLIGQIV